MVYNSNDNSERVNDSGGGVSNDEVYRERAEPMLVSLSNSYLKLNSISVCISGFSSSPTSYFLLTIFSTDYCPKEKVNNFGLRRLFYPKQNLKDACCSPA